MSTIPTRLTGGHRNTVLTAAVTRPPNVHILTGAECGEITIWSPDGQIVGKHCISDDDVTCIVCSTQRPDVFYASCGTKIHAYDLRQMTSSLCMYDVGDDEINQITLNEKENFLATADDSGAVKVINAQDGRIFKTLRKHTNICASVVFRPRRPWELLSGGYDSALLQWDFGKARCYCNIDIRELTSTPTDSVDSYLVSPPFVHTIAVSAASDRVAIGTENGIVYVFDGSRRVLDLRGTLRGHSAGVAQVHFPSFVDGRYLVSGGNDGHVCVWDVAGEIGGEVALSNGHASSEVMAVAHHASSAMPKHVIEHPEKINWLSSGATHNRKFIIVVDNTDCPVVFPFPL